jgi:hypothetical protein
MLASMRSHKKKPMGFFKKELLVNHNRLVDKIADYVNVGISENFFSFDKFREVFFLNEEEEREKEESLSEFHILTRSDLARIADSPAPELAPEEITEEPPTKYAVSAESPVISTLKRIANIVDKQTSFGEDVILMHGKFMPFNNGHLTVCKDNLAKGYRTVIAAKFPSYGNISEDTLKKSMERVCECEPELLAGYMICDASDYRNMVRSLAARGIRVIEFVGSPEDCNEFSCLLNEKIATSTSQQLVKAETVRKAMQEGNYEKYKKLVPGYMHSMFYKIKNEISE